MVTMLLSIKVFRGINKPANDAHNLSSVPLWTAKEAGILDLGTRQGMPREMCVPKVREATVACIRISLCASYILFIHFFLSKDI